MDRSLKERVIGASVLVALAVWLIPWVLDGPVPDAESGAAQTPAAERSAPLRTQTIRLENRQNTSAQSDKPDIPASPTPQDSEAVARVSLEAPAGAQPGAVAAPVHIPATAGAQVEVEPGWLVQVGSFGDEENARQVAGRLVEAGYTARLYPHRSGGNLMYRVRVGPEPSREGADEIASSLRNRGYVAQVVSSD